MTTAAQLTYGPLAELKTEAIEQMLASKFWGPFFAACRAAPFRRRLENLTLGPRRPPAGAQHLRGRLVESGPGGLRQGAGRRTRAVWVNCISPGVVETAGWSFMAEKDRLALLDHLRTTLPARRIGDPADLAGAAVSVITNPYITGRCWRSTEAKASPDRMPLLRSGLRPAR